MRKEKLLKVIQVLESQDGTSKKVIQAVTTGNLPGATIETGRYIIDQQNVICLSTQIGCNMGCAFCASTLPFKYSKRCIAQKLRNLTSAEIVEQVQNLLSLFPCTNPLLFSFMGMGEPLDNLTQVKRAIKFLADKYPNSRATISTIGNNTSGILSLANEILTENYKVPIKLHLSLHAATDEKRLKLIPSANPITKTLETCHKFAEITHSYVKLNYVLVKGLNDSMGDAHTLGGLLSKHPYFVLKISDLNSPSNNVKVTKIVADRFEAIVRSYNIKTCRFTSLGTDIEAGCGRFVKSVKKELFLG